MSRVATDPAGSDWSTSEKLRLLAGIERGVWSLAGASYRFGLSPDRIAGWQRTLPSPERTAGGAVRERGLELYVELL